MRVLKILVAALICLGFACQPGGALTPEDAFIMLQHSYEKNDPEMLQRVLSERSIARVRALVVRIRKMEDAQIEALARHFEVSPSSLKNLTVRGYCALILTHDREGDVLRQAVSQRIVEVRRQEKRARVTVANGITLDFVKEGPYWKFDMRDL